MIVGGIFFSNRVINRWNRLDQQTVWASSLNVFKTRLRVIIEILGWASSWINPLGPGPPWEEFPTSEATQGEFELRSKFEEDPTKTAVAIVDDR